MTFKKLIAAGGAFLIVLGASTLGAAAAYADDGTTEPATAVTETAPEPASEPEAPPEAPPPAEEPPAEPPAEPVAEPAPVPEETEPEAPPEETGEAASPEKPQAAQRLTAMSATTDGTPYVLLAWQLPCGVADPFCAPGQTLVHHIDLTVPTLDALDNLILNTCVDWQVDLENDSAITANLIAIGVLTAPGNPPEDHAYGAVPGNPWKFVDNPDCSVTPAASGVDQICAQGTVLVNGSIQLTMITGVNYTITGPGPANVPYDASGLASNLPPGAYTVTFTLDPGYTSAVTSPLPVINILAYNGPCPYDVTPGASSADQVCVRNAVLQDGYIQLTVLTGVNYTITDSSAANVPFDAAGLASNLPPGTYTVTFTLDPGYTSSVTSPLPLITINAHNGPCGVVVDPAATGTDQTCVQNVFLTDGNIQLTMLTGVTYTITDSSAVNVPYDASGLADPVPPGTYTVSFVLDPGYITSVVSPIMITIAAYPALCDLTTAPLVVPIVTQVQLSCDGTGSYTLANDLNIAAAVNWTVDGTPGVIPGTYSVSSPGTVNVHADPAAPLYGFAGGQLQDWTLIFTAASGCELTTLALTGFTPTGLIVAATVLIMGALALFQIQRVLTRRDSLI